MDIEDRPMRPEEQFAMAEEIRRLTAEVAMLRSAPAKMISRRLAWWGQMLMRTGIVLGVIGSGLFVGGYINGGCEKEAALHPRRETTCYFVRHHIRLEEDQEVMPWQEEPWHVYRSRNTGAVNELAIAIDFSSKEGAWAFLQKWKLEACK